MYKSVTPFKFFTQKFVYTLKPKMAAIHRKNSNGLRQNGTGRLLLSLFRKHRKLALNFSRLIHSSDFYNFVITQTYR